MVLGILNHGKTYHPEFSFKNASVVREVQNRIISLRKQHSSNLTQFLTDTQKGQLVWFCCDCFSAFTKTSNYKRHLEIRNNNCSDSRSWKVDCYPTICGRIGPKKCIMPGSALTPTIVSVGTDVSTLTDGHSQSSALKIFPIDSSSKVPPALMTTLDEACAFLSPFVRPDEDVNDLALIYYPLLCHGFEGKIRQYLEYSERNIVEDPILTNWIQSGRLWLSNYAAGHIANVSANVRNRLAEFEQREIDGSTMGTRTFTLRRGIPRLLSELDSFLRFLYHFPTTLFNSYKSVEVNNADANWMIEMAIIPKILFTAAREEPENHGTLPVVCQYCLSRGFTTRGGSLKMNECGWFSSRISALMHLLRAGVCGYLVTLSGTSSTQLLTVQVMEIVASVQHGRVTNLLSPYVKRLRELNSRKPPVKNNTVNANGDITSGAYTFPYSVWSTFIPRVVEISNICFNEVFVGETWKFFTKGTISMVDWRKLDAVVTDDDRQIRLCEVRVRENIEPILAKLQAVGELCLFGLGVGAVRHEEVIRLKVTSCQWHNSYLYFWSESMKQGSMKASSVPKLVEHRLSISLSKIFVLLRYAFVASGVSEEDKLLPSLPGASMVCLLRDIFDFDNSPALLSARHLFTSIGNILKPGNDSSDNDGRIFSDTLLTEKSGHTQGTGRRAYSTWLENSDEVLYDLYHRNLGESCLDPPVVDFIPYSDTILMESLKQLLGKKARFRSTNQREMVSIATNSILRHAYIGLPCGQGKSMSWMIPMMASYLSGRHVGLRIVILPYKFLLGHMIQHAMSMIGLLRERLSVKCIESSDLVNGNFPDFLQGNSIPALLFLNLDSADTLLRLHLNRLQTMASTNILKRVYVDELQQFVAEFGFRSSYQSMRALGRIGVPIMCLSGSLPQAMAMSIMSYCSILDQSQMNPIDLIVPSDPVGDGFSLHVESVLDIANSVIECVRKHRVGACHVICATKLLVQQISQVLRKDMKVLAVTGDSEHEDQLTCSKEWYEGTHDVLVSTIVALVGNENRLCRTIVMGGFLYNVSSLVQAVGRLRPEQRGQDSHVYVFRLPFRSNDRKEAKNIGTDSFNERLNAGCLTEVNRDDYFNLFSPTGLQELLSMKRGCFLRKLSSFYGFQRDQCSRCTNCRLLKEPPQQPTDTDESNLQSRKRPLPLEGAVQNTKKERSSSLSPISTNKVAATAASQNERILRRRAEWVFCELLYRCVSCGNADCNGECVKGCYRCGDKHHFTNVCVYTSTKISNILLNKGVCFGCFDTRQRGMTNHNIKECPKRMSRKSEIRAVKIYCNE